MKHTLPRRTVLRSGALLSLSGLAGYPSIAGSTEIEAESHEHEVETEILDVHQYVASDDGFTANAYLLETKEAVVAIDAPFLLPDARTFRGMLDAIGKPLAAVFITHPHPDHYNGITVLSEGSDPLVYATSDVDEKIRETVDSIRQRWKPIYGDEYPTDITFPTELIEAGDTVSVGGLTVQVYDLGPGEAASNSVFTVENTAIAFTGDIILNRQHPFLGGGHSSEWLDQLNELRGLLADVEVLYPGHGDPGMTVELLDYQAAYLMAYRGAVTDLAEGESKLGDTAESELEARMTRMLPNAGGQPLIKLGADAVAAELAGAPIPPSPLE